MLYFTMFYVIYVLKHAERAELSTVGVFVNLLMENAARCIFFQEVQGVLEWLALHAMTKTKIQACNLAPGYEPYAQE